jgi:hypothetical protein
VSVTNRRDLLTPVLHETGLHIDVVGTFSKGQALEVANQV